MGDIFTLSDLSNLTQISKQPLLYMFTNDVEIRCKEGR